MRHMYGTYMAKNGADVFAVQCLMGHSSLATTKRYLHHAEALKKDAVEKLPALNYGVGQTGGKVVKLVPKISPQAEGEKCSGQLSA